MSWPLFSVSSALERRARAGSSRRTRCQAELELSVQCGHKVLARPRCGAVHVGPAKWVHRTPVLLGGYPGISRKHSTFQMRGSLCGSSSCEAGWGQRMGGGPPSAVSVQGSRIAGDRAGQGRPVAGPRVLGQNPWVWQSLSIRPPGWSPGPQGVDPTCPPGQEWPLWLSWLF